MELSQSPAGRVRPWIIATRLNNKTKYMKTINTMKASIMMAALLTGAVVPAQAQTTHSAAPQVLADGTGAKSMRVENMHQVRFIEIFLAGREAKSESRVPPTAAVRDYASGLNRKKP
jgi:succinylarginine dihydrolase